MIQQKNPRRDGDFLFHSLNLLMQKIFLWKCCEADTPAASLANTRQNSWQAIFTNGRFSLIANRERKLSSLNFSRHHRVVGLDKQSGLSHSGGGSEPPIDLSERMTVLEKETAAIRLDLVIVKSNYATRLDVADARNQVVIWVVSAMFLTQMLPAILKKFGM
ncbi:MAG: hypothetical protein ACRYGK_14225 [Janthinobacterium lividum]